MWKVVVPLLIARAAHAAPPVQLGNGVTLEVTRAALLVHRGKLTAHLADAQRNHYFGDGPVIDKQARTITVDEIDNCVDVPTPLVLTFDQVQSRLDNVDAYRLHVVKQYAAAATGFAKALAEDPMSRVAAINLASAQQLLGKRADAVATLAPWLAREPEAMYATVVADPELAPLLAEPALVAIAAKVPGRAGFPDGIGYSPEHHQVAVWRDECSWGYAGPDACETSIELFDTATGTRVTSLPLTEILDHDPSRRARRAAAAERTLRDLGFSAPAVVVGTETSTDADRAADKRRFALASLRIGVVSASGSVNVLRGNTSLATLTTLDRLHGARYLRDAHALVLSSGRAGREGCEGTDPTATDIVPLVLP